MSKALARMTDYNSTYQNFKWEVPEKFNWTRDVFDVWAEDPEKLAMIWVDDNDNEKRYTYAELSRLSKRLANVLQSQGVKKGDRVFILLPRLVEWWVSKLACLRMGAVFVPGTAQLTAKDLQYRFETAQGVAVLSDVVNAPKLEQIKENCPTLKTMIFVGGERDGWLSYETEMATASDEFETADTASDENAIMFFTSGTTGMPKITVHTHASYPMGHRVTGAYWLDIQPDDLHWNMSDTGWAKASWSSFFGPWNQGAALFVHHSPRFDAKKTLELLSKYPITTYCGAPTNYRVLVLEDLSQYKFTTLRHCVAAGEPLNPEVIEVWRKATGVTIRDGYGQTESCVLVANFPGQPVKEGSMGKPAPGFYVSIIDNDGNEVEPGVEGDIAVRVKPERPVGLFKEYFGEPERTAGCFKGDWYITGDRGIKDEDGYLWFVGRADDVIISSGYRIGPFEVESALIEHEAVAESAVVASPDELRGEIVKAFVVLAPGFSPSDELVKELQDFVKNNTAPYKYPREIEFVESLPKTVSGKIRRIELRELERQRKQKTKSS
ncbi:MAG: AMP-binding protein [Clostridia bacterium]|nr:AMP-binding protein [Clostridia bacterium]